MIKYVSNNLGCHASREVKSSRGVNLWSECKGGVCMAGVKIMLIGVEVILVFVLALTGWDSYKWFKTYHRDLVKMQNALYDSAFVQKEVEELEEIADASKGHFQFSLAWSIIIVVLLIGVMGMISIM